MPKLPERIEDMDDPGWCVMLFGDGAGGSYRQVHQLDVAGTRHPVWRVVTGKRGEDPSVLYVVTDGAMPVFSSVEPEVFYEGDNLPDAIRAYNETSA